MKTIEFYDQLKTPPKEVLKPIGAGRLKGMTDIKPQWRIEVMTKVFGVCGFGWRYDNVFFRHEKYANDETLCFCTLDLYVYDKEEKEWSYPIRGVGGSKTVAKEASGMHNSDEAEKMAMTDALSVAMKALGVGADVYMGNTKPDTKYSTTSPEIKDTKVGTSPTTVIPTKPVENQITTDDIPF